MLESNQNSVFFFKQQRVYLPRVPRSSSLSQVAMTELGTLSTVIGLESGTVPVAMICLGSRCYDHSLWFEVEHYKIFLFGVKTEQLVL